MSASSPKTKLNSSIAAHGAFLVVAAMLALQGGCGGPVSAAPATAATAVATTATPAEFVSGASMIESGRYLVKIGGCNDCHTPGFVETNGAGPKEEEWLMGAPVGFAGPWGVSYPANLRLSFANMTEEQFIEMSRAGKGRPPMPWPSLMAMSDQDLKAIYAYMRFLGPKGQTTPAAVSPGGAVNGPVINFMPQMPQQKS